jgi:ParB/RepB/Spo0J family partition protein
MNTTTDQHLRSLPLVDVVANPGQPRKHFDRVALDELTASIAAVGLLEPIIVRPVDGQYVIVAGERRWRAAQAAGLATIPAIVRELGDAEAFELSMIENVIRADMNAIEEANGYQMLLASGMDVATIASRIGKSAGQISARVKLLRLDPAIQKLVADGQMDAYDAGHVAKLTIEGQYRVIRAMNGGQLRFQGDLVRLTSAIALEESQSSMFAEDAAPITPIADLRATRDLRTALVDALTALDRIERTLDAAGQANETDEIALLGEQLKRRANVLASRVHAQRAAATARKLAIA